jgi:hypothetical protein
MVNLYADMGNVQPGSLRPGLVRATQSTDHTPPSSRITGPATNAHITPGSTVTISGTATDAGGGHVAGVEVSVDGGVTWHRATGHDNWTYTWTVQSNPGPVTLRSRAVDDSGNLETPSAGINVQVGTGNPLPAVGFVLSATWANGNELVITVRAVDANGNTVTNFHGTVALTDNNQENSLGSHTFTANDFGVFSFRVHPFTQHRTTVTARDGSLTGSLELLNN